MDFMDSLFKDYFSFPVSFLTRENTKRKRIFKYLNFFGLLRTFIAAKLVLFSGLACNHAARGMQALRGSGSFPANSGFSSYWIQALFSFQGAGAAVYSGLHTFQGCLSSFREPQSPFLQWPD